MEQVLVICTDDVCVGPLVVESLRRALEAAPRVEVVVTSAGVRPGAARCQAPHGRHSALHDTVGGREPPSLLTADMVLQAALVLTTERRLCGSARILDLSSALRTFTVVEAGELAAASVPPVEFSGVSEDDRRPVAWLVAEMDARRGTVAARAPKRFVPRWRGDHLSDSEFRSKGFDLQDPHGSTWKRSAWDNQVHRATVNIVDALTRRRSLSAVG